MTTELEAEYAYEHAEHGEVLVLGVHRVYDWFDAKAGEGEERGVFVRYATDWDGYGPMMAAVRNESVEEFVPGVEYRVGRVTFDAQPAEE